MVLHASLLISGTISGTKLRYFIVLVRYENDREVRYEGTVLNIFLGTNYEKSIVPYRTVCSDDR